MEILRGSQRAANRVATADEKPPKKKGRAARRNINKKDGSNSPQHGSRSESSKNQQIKKPKDELDALKLQQKKAQQGSHQRSRTPPRKKGSDTNSRVPANEWQALCDVRPAGSGNPQRDVSIRSAPSSMDVSFAEGRIASSTGTLVPNDWQTMSVQSTAGPLECCYVNHLCEPLRQAQSMTAPPTASGRPWKLKAGSKASDSLSEGGGGLIVPASAVLSLTARPLRRWLVAPARSTFISVPGKKRSSRDTSTMWRALCFFGAKQVGSQPLSAAARFVPNALLDVFDAFGEYQEQDWVQFTETVQQRYMFGSHWTILVWQVSPIWPATYIGNLTLSAHHKVVFDLCAFGHPNRKRGSLVSSSNVFRFEGCDGLAAGSSGHTHTQARMQQHITCRQPSWMYSLLPSCRWHLRLS